MSNNAQFFDFASSLNSSQSLLHAPRKKALDDEWNALLSFTSSSDDEDTDLGLPLFDDDELEACVSSTPEESRARKHHMDPDELLPQWQSQCPLSPMPKKSKHLLLPSPKTSDSSFMAVVSTSGVPPRLFKGLKRVASLTAVAA